MAQSFHPLVGILLCIHFRPGASTNAIPPWTDQKQNPCAAEPNGWQLLFWPLDGKCYKIFQKGYPCPESMEITPGKGGIAECQCPPGTAQSPRDAICYKLFTKGPCEPNEYFAPIADDPRRHRWGICQPINRCDEGEVFWPKEKKCHKLFIRGPCSDGLLLGDNEGVGECLCNQTTMSSQYWEPSATCYEHYVQGPCEKGQVFLPGGTCGCDITFKQYHPETNLCYTVGSTGPCMKGHKYIAIYNETTKNENGACFCKDGYVLWPENGQCYRPFTRGPCEQGSMLDIDYEREIKQLQCIPLPCGPAKLYFPGGKGCHKVGTNGPCPEDQVVLFQENPEQSLETVSYLGVCGCQIYQPSSESFYPTLRGLKPSENGKCSSTRKLDPDPNPASSKEASGSATEGVRTGKDPCISKRGMVLWTDNTCQPLYNQGPCKDGEWVVPDRGKGQRQGRGWKMGKCECRPGYTITTADRGIICQSPSVMLAKFLSSNGDKSTNP
ncbi:hypothetical protein GE061_001214 [Apolygus lucorum]|uniref:DUF4789 domain-containing protein n=1 Tax=Apolygus lucorum TaxID=248454 RepID=A0A6A4KHZ2_APOLU|nr:hypothetical protein GE061_001214 [Apolygus lucorum]